MSSGFPFFFFFNPHLPSQVIPAAQKLSSKAHSIHIWAYENSSCFFPTSFTSKSALCIGKHIHLNGLPHVQQKPQSSSREPFCRRALHIFSVHVFGTLLTEVMSALDNKQFLYDFHSIRFFFLFFFNPHLPLQVILAAEKLASQAHSIHIWAYRNHSCFFPCFSQVNLCHA